MFKRERLSLLGIAATLTFLANCKQSGDSGVYLYGGESVAQQDELLFSNASIGKVTNTKESYPAFCSGVVVEKNLLLTSASCFDKTETRLFAHFAGQSTTYADALILQSESNAASTTTFGLALLAFASDIPSPAQVVPMLEGKLIPSPSEPLWMYAMGTSSKGVYGEIQRMKVSLAAKHPANGYAVRGMLASGDENAALFLEGTGGLRLIGVASARAKESEDETHFIDIRSMQEWVSCAAANAKIFMKQSESLPENCPVLELYGLEKPN